MSVDTDPPSREQDLLRRLAELEHDNESLRRRLNDDALYRSLAEHSGDVITRTDPIGTVLYISPSCRTVLGYEPAELVGRFGGELVHPDDLAEVARSVPEQFRRENVATVTYRARRKDGTDVWIESTIRAVLDPRTGEFLGGHATSRDVSERRRAEEELRHQHELLRTIFDHVPVMLAFIDPRGRFQMVNRRWEEVMGWSLEEARAHPDLLAELYPDPEYRRSVLEYILHPPPGWAEFHTRVRDGRVIDTAWANVLLSDGTSIGLGQDISDRKRAEAERRRLEEKMRETQKLESLGVLAGGIAHEFNNLLTSILGYANLSVDQVPASSPVRGFLRQIDRAGRRAADLCEQMLAYAGKGRYVVTPLDLSGVVREVAGLMHVSLPCKATLSPRLADRLPAVRADATQMRQVVMNLVMNASEALPSEGGLVTVSTRAAALDSHRLARMQLGEELPPGEYVGLEVTDTGGGMDEATRARIFEPFFTTKFVGRGLGLSAVLGIVRSHKGALEVDTAPGRGSTFRVWFPAVAAEVNAPPSPEAYRGAGLALVAEDEDGIRQLLELVLREAGFEVVAVADGQEAIDRVTREPDRFRLALVDLTMPRRDGVEVVAELARLAPVLPVILMSGHSVHQVGELLAGRRVAGFLPKPFTRADVIEYLRNLPIASSEPPA